RLKEEVARQRQAGLRCDWLEADEVRERWPGAAPECHGALFAPEDGALDPQALTRACLADARRLGAALRPEPVESIQVAQGRVTGVVTAAGTTSVEHAVLAAGVWSPRIRGLPRALPIQPFRGRDPDVERLWYATGHGRNGILLAALTGEIIADLVTKGATDVEIAPLGVDRFSQPQDASHKP